MDQDVASSSPKPLEEDAIDLKGNSVDKAVTGRWKACSFLVGFEACERMSFYGIASSLVIYLTTQLHEGTVASATNVNNWGGAIWISPLLGAFIADNYLGRFWTFSLFSIVYIAGMCCLTAAASLPALKPPACSQNGAACPHATTTQVGFFYFAIYLLCLGTGGTKPNISSFGADQFDDDDPKERIQKLSFFNWWFFSISFGSLLGQSALVYIQDNVGWGWGYAVPTLGLVVSVCIFLSGTPFYRHKRPSGNVFSRICQVIAAATWKWDRYVPADGSSLYELQPEQYAITGKTRLVHSSRFRFLDKAAVREGTDQNILGEASPWKLCTVTQVEETKLVVGMIPIWLGSLLFTAVMTNVTTFFIKQGSTLNTHMGPRFQIPPASLGFFASLTVLLLVPIYDKALVPFLHRFTGNKRGITLLQRMGIGIFIQIIVMIVAALVETKRLRTAKDHGLLDSHQPLPMSIFWLLPQYILIGVAETFTGIATLEFFYDQAPNNMKSIGTAIYTTNIGVGHYVSSLLITVVHKVTSMNGKQSWLVDNLNRCHLDYYYWLLTVLTAINAGVFVLLAKHYTYKTIDDGSMNMEFVQRPPELHLTNGSVEHRESFVSPA